MFNCLPSKGIAQAQVINVIENFYPKYDPATGGPHPTRREKQSRIVLSLLGTSNPDREGEPHILFVFCRDVKSLVWVDQNNCTHKSDWYDLLRKAGFYVEGMDHMSSEDLNKRALIGAYMLVEVDYKETRSGDIIPTVKKDTKGPNPYGFYIEPPKVPEQREANEKIRDELFKVSV